uniref:Uncharacterized protein n=1 Tax=Heterorhabditis bacteriophora TaxID=37862 RepID=A0A1I7WEW6_HETBA
MIKRKGRKRSYCAVIFIPFPLGREK